jgi:general secretion pathway protein A
MSYLSDKMKIIWMAEPPERSIELLSFVSRDLGIEPLSATSKVFLIKDIKEHLLKFHGEGKRCLIIIDEAHQLTNEVIGGVRLLNNLEEGADKLIQIILIGQDELMNTISRPELTSFKQRIANIELIGRMDEDKIREYILHRLRVAGARDTNIFSETGMEAIVSATGGIPRLINTLCHRSLTAAFKREKDHVDMEEVDEAAQYIGLGRETFRYITKARLKEKERQGAFQKDESPLPLQDIKHVPLTTNEIPLKPVVNRSISVKKGKQKKEKASITVSILFFLSSIVALLLSILFYCGKLGSSASISCIEELFRNMLI